ncbi:M24 family metallopeptidase [Cupriavidus sp. D39]|uniref:M24 family metallopeptidase n=1 Tax=Cupriavidus sp. D39 TaxID=2997877 RepID=UPI002272258E|nr:Xaa-Pro peptidase family protein [Cupriavidus sp. D39]MCY0853372.1 Xaa-Pro peptidase family protein [Cupriavidus sp. D39]
MNKEIHFEKQSPSFYAGDVLHAIKQKKLQKALEASGFDAFLFFKAEAVRWVSDFYVKGFRPFLEPEYVALVVKGKPPVVGYISGSDDLRIRFKSDIEDARRLPHVSKWHETIAKMLSDYGVANGRVATDIMPHMVYKGLGETCPNLEIGDVSSMWLQLTAVKDPIEVDLIRNSLKVADLGALAAIKAIKPGVSEHSVAAEAVYAMRRAGSEFEPFIPLVASGSNASMFERIATEKIIQAGEMVIFDLGAVVKGYTADLGRTVICGGEPTAKQREVYRATHLALQEAKKMIRPGVTGKEIDARAREVIADSGWGDYVYTGNTGHQLGYGLHGEPLVDRRVDFVVEENMVMCLEPRIVLPDQPEVGGAHLEDVVVVTANGYEQLNTTPYDDRLLG